MSAPTDVTTPGSALELLIPWPSPGQALVRSPTGDIEIDQTNAHLVTAPTSSS